MRAGLLLSLFLVGGAGAAMAADPPAPAPTYAATIPEPPPVAATIPQPAATTVSEAKVNGVGPVRNYGSVADTKLICKTEVPINSRLGGHRVCLTKADWEKQARNVQDFMNSRIGAPTAVR